MAVTFDAVASATGFTATTTTLTFAHTCGASANLLVVGVGVGPQGGSDSGMTISGVTYNGVAMTSLGALTHNNGNTVGFTQVWYLVNPTTGSSQNVVVTRAGGAGTTDIIANAVSYGGAGTPTGLATTTGATATATASKTPATGEMAVQFVGNGASISTLNQTSRFIDNVNGLSAGGNIAYQDVVGNGTSKSFSMATASDWWSNWAFIIPASVSAGVDFGAGDWLLEDGSGAWLLEDSTGNWILDTTASAPVTATVTMAGTNTLAATGSVGTVVQMVGASTLTVSGIKKILSVITQVGTNTLSIVLDRFPASISGTGRYLQDQFGAPWLYREAHSWNLVPRAGEHNELGVGTTTPAGVFAGLAAKLKAQGFNALEVQTIGGNGGANLNGTTWDSVAPFTGGVIGTLNNSYWTRVDDMIDAMAAKGIACILLVASSYAMASGGALNGLNTTNGATYGTALGNRYKTKPNIVWQFGVDDFGFQDSIFQAITDAIQATGDTHLITRQAMAESNSRTDSTNATVGAFGTNADITHDEIYSYNCTYLETERDYILTSPSVRPTLFSNGRYDQTGTSGTGDWKLYSDGIGWALTSGSKGMYYGSENTWQWNTTAYADTSNLTFANGPWLTTMNWFAGLTNWQNLIPDFGSLGFITAARGTKATAFSPGGSGGFYIGSPQNNYLTGAVTADGKLALLYTPTSRTITIDGTKMVSSYTAKWVDPYTGAVTAATPSATSYAHPGNNSQGQANWYLLLEESTAVTATVTMAGTNTLAVAGVPARVAAVSVVNTNVLAVTGRENIPVTATMAGTNTLAVATPRVSVISAPTLTGVNTLAVSTLQQVRGVVTQVGVNTLAVSTLQLISGTITQAGVNTLVVSVLQQISSTITQVSVNALTVSTLQQTSGVVTQVGVNTLTVAGQTGTLAVVTVTGLNALAVSGQLAISSTANMASSNVLSISGILTTSSSVTFVGVNTLAVSGVTGVAIFVSNTNTLSVGGQVRVVGIVALVGVNTLSISGQVITVGVIALVGTNTLAIVAFQVTSSVVTSSGVNVLSVSSLVRETAAVTMVGVGILAVSTLVQVRSTTALAGVNVVTVSVSQSVSTAATLVGLNALTISAVLQRTVLADLVGVNGLTISSRQAIPFLGVLTGVNLLAIVVAFDGFVGWGIPI